MILCPHHVRKFALGLTEVYCPLGMDTGEAIAILEHERFIPLELAALNLQISQRQLRNLLTQHGMPVFHFGQRSKRVSEADLQQLIRASAVKPRQTEVA